MIPKKKNVLAGLEIRKRLAAKLNEYDGTYVVWTDRLSNALILELKDAGWKVENTHKPSAFDSPSTVPTYKIS